MSSNLVRVFFPEDDPMVLLSVERATSTPRPFEHIAAQPLSDDDTPSINDIPWRF